MNDTNERGGADDDALKLIRARSREARREARRELWWANSNSSASYLCGFLGIAGGAIAASTVTAHGVPSVVPIVAGIIAALGSGMAPLFNFQRTAVRRARQAAIFKCEAEFAESEYVRVLPLGPNADETLAALRNIDERLRLVRLSDGLPPDTAIPPGPFGQP
jgi:hypothetical protein